MTLFGLLIFVPLTIAHTGKYQILPPTYELDDYVTCLKTDGLYCKVDVRLENGSDNNTLWNLIKESINDKYSHNRNVIHKATCIPKKEARNLNMIRTFSESLLDKKLKGTNLLPHIEEITCETKDAVFTTFDTNFLVFLVIYISLILLATIYDIRYKRLKSETLGNKTILSLSLISNWNKLCNIEGNEDYNKLKSIQGIRFYNMILIINLHTLYSSSLTYLSNPEEIGKFFFTGALGTMNYVGVLYALLVQTFLLISTWIVTFQTYNFYKEYGKLTVKHVCIILVNRFFRLCVCNTVMMSIMRLSWSKLIPGPITFNSFILSQKSCTQNWWYTFFFINNYSVFITNCNPASWYLSVDFQLYTMTVITLYLIFKFKLSEKKVVGSLLLLSCILYGTDIYDNKLDILFKINTKLYNDYFPIGKLYMSTISNWSTSIVGLGFGILYTKNKKFLVTKNRVVSSIWMLLFFGLPSTAILIAENEFSEISAALVGPLIKPLYALGIGIGILGMSQNRGGIIKRVCENKYVVLMSNFSYSTYIFQIGVIFIKGLGSYSLMEFGTSQLVKYFLILDLPLSLLVGVLGALLFEQPGINLQKIMLPQLPRERKLHQKNL